MAEEKYITIEEAATRLGKTVAEIGAMIIEGALHGLRDGQSWRLRSSEVDELAGGEEKADKKGDTLMSIDADIVFAEDEAEPADSAAETWIAAEAQGGVFESAPTGAKEAMRGAEIEPAPLALSPESDDTSLGAVLEEQEEGPIAEEPIIAVDAESGLASLSTPTPRGPSRTQVVTLLEGPAQHPAFTALLALGVLVMGFAVFMLMAEAIGASVGFVRHFEENALMYTALLFLAVVVIVVIGFALGRQAKGGEALSASGKKE